MAKTLKRLSWALSLLLPLSAWPANLLHVFQEARQNDPTLGINQAQMGATREKVPISRADLLPSLSGTGEYDYNDPATGANPGSADFNLSLNQTLFNWGDWQTYRSATWEARAAELSYAAAIQDLIVRTAQAYFDVLQAQDKLHLSQLNRQALAVELQQNQLRFKAGLVKTTDVDSAQAAYDGSLGDVLDGESDKIAKQAALQATTGVEEKNLAPLKTQIPLIQPQPARLSEWLAKIEEQNLTVLADQSSAEASNAAIKAAQAGHLPSLSAEAGYTRNTQNSVNTYLAPTSLNATQASVKLDIPLFSGGKVSAQARQAAYQHQEDLEKLRKDYYEAEQNTRSSFIDVVNGMRKLQSDQAALASYQRALKSTRTAYQAGLANVSISDVLEAQRTLYNTERQYVQDRYAYLMSMLKLKQAAGTLSVADLVSLNQWLERK